MAGIFPILANKAYYQVANFKWEKWWAWQGLNLRPLRCQHSALPLSYTPTLERACRERLPTAQP